MMTLSKRKNGRTQNLMNVFLQRLMIIELVLITVACGLGLLLDGSTWVILNVAFFYFFSVIGIMLARILRWRRSSALSSVLTGCFNARVGSAYLVAIVGLALLFGKFLIWGIPSFSTNPEFARVDFLNILKIPTDIVRYSVFFSIVYLAMAQRFWSAVLVSIALGGYGFLAAFRSEAVMPFILIFSVYFCTNTFSFRLKFGLLAIFLGMLGWQLLVFITALRFPSFDSSDVSALLVHRIFYVNVENFYWIVEAYGDDPRYLGTFVDDFLSVIGIGESFSTEATRLSGGSNFQYFQMTPTVLGEAFANFGWFFGPAGALVLFAVNLLAFLLLRLLSTRPFIFSAAIWVVLMLPLFSMTNGLGSFLFNYLPKGIIAIFYSGILFYFFNFIGMNFRRSRAIS